MVSKRPHGSQTLHVYKECKHWYRTNNVEEVSRDLLSTRLLNSIYLQIFYKVREVAVKFHQSKENSKPLMFQGVE